MKIKTFLALLLLVIVGCSCSKTDKDTDTILYGTWKLIGIQGQDGKIREPNPTEKECPKCFTITFRKNNTLEGKSSSNDIIASYILNTKEATLTIPYIGGTKVMENEDGNIFRECLIGTTHYVVDNNKVTITNNKQQSLSLKKINAL